MINSISLNPKYNVSFYGNKKINELQVPQRKLDVSIYGEKTANTIPFAQNYNALHRQLIQIFAPGQGLTGT